MAFGDFADLAQAVCRRSRRRSDDTDDLSAAKTALNEAYLATCDTSETWRFLLKEGQFTVSSAADTYTFASIATVIGLNDGDDVNDEGIAEILTLTNDTTDMNYPPLTALPWDQLEALAASTQDSDPTGPPFYWTRWDGASIRIYPKPDQTYTLGVLCLRSPLPLSSDADEPLIPLPWRHRLLVPYAAANLLFEDGGYEALYEAQVQMALYDQDYTKFVIAHARAKAPTATLIGPTFNDDRPGGATGDAWVEW